jgi:hypothetical protein
MIFFSFCSEAFRNFIPLGFEMMFLHDRRRMIWRRQTVIKQKNDLDNLRNELLSWMKFLQNLYTSIYVGSNQKIRKFHNEKVHNL